MKKKDIERFKERLEEERRELLRRARQTLQDDMALDLHELSDELDFAASQADQGLILRLRGREKGMLRKINVALQRIEDGEFGVCDRCGEDIALKRLEIRPVTTLCIHCKQEQEEHERMLA